ncbi:hypothetical protein ES705_49996 [subsurface metagenome]
MYLIGTNIFFELLLEQTKAKAEKYNLLILSFDKDFDRTERGRKEPGYL